MAIAALSLLAASRHTRDSAESDGETDSLGRLEWIDDSYSTAAAGATVLALLGALLAKDGSANDATHEGGGSDGKAASEKPTSKDA